MAATKITETPQQQPQPRPQAEWKIEITECDQKEASESKSGKRGAPQKAALLLCQKFADLAAEDPRRVTHALKVGLALALVSLLYFMNPVFESFGENSVWSVMTVVVVMDFSAGATFSKGLNRMVATLVGGALAVAVNAMADLAGRRTEPFVLDVGIFLVAVVATFVRFFPSVKSRYDYGMLIFLLTYAFEAISGYRNENLWVMAYQRALTIVMGCCVCGFLSLVFFPVWAGQDLHQLTARNLHKVAVSLQGCIELYFAESCTSGETDKILNGYKCVLNSKASEESLANFARWEPPHGKFRMRHPWKQYIKVGAALRYCAYCVESLNSCLNSQIQTPQFLREHLKAPCINIASAAAAILMETSESIENMKKVPSMKGKMVKLTKLVEDLHEMLASEGEIYNAKIADSHSMSPSMEQSSETDNTLVRDEETEECSSRNEDEDAEETGGENTWEKDKIIVCVMDTLPLLTVASLLTELCSRLQSLAAAVSQLAEDARFQIF